MNKTLSPFFKYFGSKARSAKLYPEPLFPIIVEPFAGGAGYSLNYWKRSVVLYDSDPVVIGIWKFLIRASSADILAMPLLEMGQKTDELDIPQEQKWLIGAWCNVGCFKAKSLCSWALDNPDTFWGESKRAAIARQVEAINHWSAELCSYSELTDTREATWFIDPPYEALANHYTESKQNPIDFQALGEWCRSRNGQVIVCEQEGASWLPFKYLGRSSAARGNRKSCEALWLNRPLKQLSLFGEP